MGSLFVLLSSCSFSVVFSSSRFCAARIRSCLFFGFWSFCIGCSGLWFFLRCFLLGPWLLLRDVFPPAALRGRGLFPLFLVPLFPVLFSFFSVSVSFVSLWSLCGSFVLFFAFFIFLSVGFLFPLLLSSCCLGRCEPFVCFATPLPLRLLLCPPWSLCAPRSLAALAASPLAPCFLRASMPASPLRFVWAPVAAVWFVCLGFCGFPVWSPGLAAGGVGWPLWLLLSCFAAFDCFPRAGLRTLFVSGSPWDASPLAFPSFWFAGVGLLSGSPLFCFWVARPAVAALGSGFGWARSASPGLPAVSLLARVLPPSFFDPLCWLFFVFCLLAWFQGTTLS